MIPVVPKCNIINALLYNTVSIIHTNTRTHEHTNTQINIYFIHIYIYTLYILHPLYENLAKQQRGALSEP